MTLIRQLADRARQSREQLLRERRMATAEMPLKYWCQQAHFTTPASGTPEKAIQGLAAARKLLQKFDISPAELADHAGAPLSTLRGLIEQPDCHTPLVMVDCEDAVALDAESARKARAGAIRCFSQANWGSTLAFFRPAGLTLDGCIDDLFEVLPAVASERVEHYPIDGLIWPKVEHPNELVWLNERLGEIEHLLGLPEQRIKLQFLVESGYALAQLPELVKAVTPRLTGIIWGIADYAADVNLPELRNDHPSCDWARQVIVNVAGAVNVPAIDNMTLNYPTPLHRGEGLSLAQQQANKLKVLNALKEAYQDACHGIRLGMSGKWVGHPGQLLMVLAAYQGACSQAQLDQDIAEIELYQRSVASGSGATMIGRGEGDYMADRATDRHLRARLRRATAWGRLDAQRAASLGIINENEFWQLDARANPASEA